MVVSDIMYEYPDLSYAEASDKAIKYLESWEELFDYEELLDDDGE